MNKEKYKLKKVYIFSRMPLLSNEIRKDGKYGTGMQTYAWYVWENGYNGYPKIDWIDCKKWVLRKGE
jgi:hypothetical protein